MPLPTDFRSDRLFDTGAPTPAETRARAADNAAAQHTLFDFAAATEAPVPCPHTAPFPEETP